MILNYRLIGSTTNFHKYETKDTVGVLYVPRAGLPDPAPEVITVEVKPATVPA